ncbi:MAG: NAD(P)H-dependent glycerol-3-phosphate dehydrogenase [Rikenellaceae bacterium]
MELNITSKSNCAVIGYGSWATAIVKMLCQGEKRVGWHIRNEGVLEIVTQEARNPKYLREVEFNLDKLYLSSDINDIVAKHDIIILAMPSAFIKEFLLPLTESLKGKFVVSAIKGIVPGDYLTIVEYLHKHYDLSYKQLGIISGPSHAEEIAMERMSFLTVVCPNLELAHVMGDKLKNKYINVGYSKDLYGVEYATVLKNIYAISVGMAVGLGYGDNFLAVLIANCAREMNNFVEQSYPDSRETRESSYLGDLLVTCYSTYSRNRRLGLLMGKGFSTKSALNEMTMIAEGYFASDCIKHINEANGVEMPIADMVHSVLYNRASARKSMINLTKMLR